MQQSKRAEMATGVLRDDHNSNDRRAGPRPFGTDINGRRAGEIRAICEKRGIRIYDTPGGALRLIGQDVDVTTTDLAFVIPSDLQPFTEREAKRAARRAAGQNF